MKSNEGQRARIKARLEKGGVVPSVILHREGSGKPEGFCGSFSKRISEIRQELLPTGKDIVCTSKMVDGQRRTAYEIVDVPLALIDA